MNYFKITLIVFTSFAAISFYNSGFASVFDRSNLNTEKKDFQSGQTTVSLDKLTIPGGKGNLIVLKKQVHARFVHDLQMGKKITIVTMGTSLTGGAYRWPDVMMTDWLDKEFPAQVTLYNEGVGTSASSIGLNGDPKLSGLGKLPVVISHNPDVVIIEFGTNDAYLPYNISLNDSRKNLETMINTILKANPKTEIILATMNSCKDNPSVPHASSNRPRLDRYFQGYRKIAKARNLILLDFYPAWLRLMKDDPARFDKFVPDGVHPSLEAYRTILLPILRQTLDPGYSTNPFQRVKKGK